MEICQPIVESNLQLVDPVQLNVGTKDCCEEIRQNELSYNVYGGTEHFVFIDSVEGPSYCLLYFLKQELCIQNSGFSPSRRCCRVRFSLKQTVKYSSM